MGQAPKHESQYKITELEAEKGDAKMTLVPCILALIISHATTDAPSLRAAPLDLPPPQKQRRHAVYGNLQFGIWSVVTKVAFDVSASASLAFVSRAAAPCQCSFCFQPRHSCHLIRRSSSGLRTRIMPRRNMLRSCRWSPFRVPYAAVNPHACAAGC